MQFWPVLTLLAAALASGAAPGAQWGDSTLVTQLAQSGELPPAAVVPKPKPTPTPAPTPTSTSLGGLPQRPQLLALRELLAVPAVLPLQGSGAPTSLADAVLLGLQNSLDVRAAHFREKSFEQTRNAARGALLPRVEVRLAAGRGYLESNDPPLSLKRGDASVVLSQAVFDEPARQEWSRQELLAASAKAQRAGAESQALLDTGSAWFVVLQQRVTVELSKDYEALLGELLRYMTDRVAAGGASPAERERIAARVANLRSAQADTRAALTAALRNFQRLTDTAPFALAIDTDMNFGVADDVEFALAQARSSNYELLSARIEQQAAEAERLGRRGAFAPRVSVELTHVRSHNAAGTESYLRDNKAMVVVTMPLLTGGADYAQMQAAEARRNELQARAEGTLRRVVQDIETSYANLRAASERFKSVRDELEGNRKVVDAFSAQLTGGNRQVLDVLDAYQRLHQSRLDLMQVLVTTAQNEFRIAHLTGTLRAVVAH